MAKNAIEEIAKLMEADADIAPVIKKASDEELMLAAVDGLQGMARTLADISAARKKRCVVCEAGGGKECAHCLAEELRMRDVLLKMATVQLLKREYRRRKGLSVDVRARDA